MKKLNYNNIDSFNLFKLKEETVISNYATIYDDLYGNDWNIFDMLQFIM